MVFFYIAARRTIGSDEFDMITTRLDLVSKNIMTEEVRKFQENGKLKLKGDKYLTDHCQNIHQLDMDPCRKNKASEWLILLKQENHSCYFSQNIYITNFVLLKYAL